MLSNTVEKKRNYFIFTLLSVWLFWHKYGNIPAGSALAAPEVLQLFAAVLPMPTNTHKKTI